MAKVKRVYTFGDKKAEGNAGMKNPTFYNKRINLYFYKNYY